MHRVYDMWTPKQDIGNPFYTTFRYSLVSLASVKDETEHVGFST